MPDNPSPYSELLRYIKALLTDMTNISGFLMVHGFTNPWENSGKVYGTLPFWVQDDIEEVLTGVRHERTHSEAEGLL